MILYEKKASSKVKLYAKHLNFLMQSGCTLVLSNLFFQYYHADGESSAVQEKNNTYGWLEEIEMPNDSQMDGIKYMGPPIIETAC